MPDLTNFFIASGDAVAAWTMGIDKQLQTATNSYIVGKVTEILPQSRSRSGPSLHKP